ncbi:MAG: hypothetical protein ACTS77_01350 [Arsenophonus sp. NC-TX2-MAG3]
MVLNGSIALSTHDSITATIELYEHDVLLVDMSDSKIVLNELHHK